jgi:hypothetical protein
MDPSGASERCVAVQALPLVDNLSTAKVLKKNLRGAREAIYYGLMPGLIFSRGTKRKEAVPIKWLRQIRKFNQENSADKRVECFLAILRSLIDGEITKHGVPSNFHALLDASSSPSGAELVCWPPYHLQFVLEKLDIDDPDYNMIQHKMAGLCIQVLESTESSGDGWEALFVLFILARCLNRKWLDPIFPEPEFESSQKPTVTFNESLSGTLLDQCKNWND